MRLVNLCTLGSAGTIAIWSDWNLCCFLRNQPRQLIAQMYIEFFCSLPRTAAVVAQLLGLLSVDVALFRRVVGSLATRGLAYLHLIEARADEAEGEAAGLHLAGVAPTAALFRPLFRGVLLAPRLHTGLGVGRYLGRDGRRCRVWTLLHLQPRPAPPFRIRRSAEPV